ncbi:MAG: hypothetical protein PHV78_02625 [Patescibacteria group bacterium]|nr:hypothetical protein [Patescibacteria group bacterium]MDD5121715.1 hypothetical protein [Patescibacteria group bacterium]MDD5221710.1 hypothetical protein [Patescibacteria group bacterium]MDD5396121.1 hypothetical protein [Patescibacteria group bacterium]
MDNDGINLDLWNKLSAVQKKTRIEFALKIIINVAQIQKQSLKNIKKFGNPDAERFLYFEKTLDDIWENIKFAISLGKGKNRKFAFYPARSVLENFFRLDYFTQQNPQEQKNIAMMEALKVCKIMYDQEKTNNHTEGMKSFNNHYQKVSDGTYQDIDSINLSSLDAFPSMKEMMKRSNLLDGNEWYFIYRSLSESAHGKFMARLIRELDDRAEYIRSLMCLNRIAIETIKITDFHLRFKTKDDVKRVIIQAKSIIERQQS